MCRNQKSGGTKFGWQKKLVNTFPKKTLAIVHCLSIKLTSLPKTVGCLMHKIPIPT